MVRKLFSTTTNSITGAAIILGAASFLSRVIGVVRDRIFAHQFGASEVLDAYYAAFRIPDLVYMLIVVGALSAGFIPVFLEFLEKDKKEAWEITSGVLNILGISLIVVCLVLMFFTPSIMRLLVPGFNEVTLAQTVILTRIMFLSPILLGLSGVVSSVLQSFRSFLVYALTPILYNIGIIAGAMLFVPKFGVVGLAYGVILGAAAHLLIQLPTLFHHGFSYSGGFHLKHAGVRKIFGMMLPRTLGLATTQLNLVAITFIASLLSVGSLSVFNFANNLQHFPVGIIGISFAVAAFPTLASFAAKKDHQAFMTHFSNTIRQIFFFILPLSLAFILLRAQIVRVVLGSGQFDWADTVRTADTLALFTISLFAQALIPLFARGFYALKDTWTPLFAGIIGATATIGASWALKDMYGVAGLALGFSIGAILQLVFLWLFFRLKVKTQYEGRTIIALFKISIGLIAMAATTQGMKLPLSEMVDMTRFWGILTQGAIAGGTGLLVYGLACWMLQVEEMEAFLKSLGRRWLRLTNIQGEIDEPDQI